MITEIDYIPQRWRYTEFAYDVLVAGKVVAAASTYHAGEVVAWEYQEREGLLEDIRQAVHAAAIEIEGMRLIAPTTTDQQPLLAQCAALIDTLLGGPVIGGGILDELRRVCAALAQEGW